MHVLPAATVLLGLAFASGQTPPPTQESKQEAARRDLKTWFEQSDPYGFQFSMTYVTGGKIDWTVGTGSGTVTADGILHLVVAEPPSRGDATGHTPTTELKPAKSFDLYKLGGTLSMRSPAGAWASFTLKDCEPEIVDTPTSTSISGFSRKLLSVVGGPSIPNDRAGAIQSLAYVQDPRSLVHKLVGTTQGLTDKLEPKASEAAANGIKVREVTIPLPYEKTSAIPGVFLVGTTAITIRVDEKLQVTAIVISVRAFDRENEADRKKYPASTIVQSFTSIADVQKEEVPADVVKLLQPAPAGK
jgi:hypothetical protein